MEFAIKMFFVVLVLSIASLATVFIVVWSAPDVSNAFSGNELCLPDTKKMTSLKCGSSDGVLHEFLINAVYRKYEDKKKEENEESKSETQQIQLKHYRENKWEMLPAAKLTGTEQPMPRETDNNNDMVPIREWKSGSSVTDVGGFLRYGIKYQNGRLVVPVSGTYHTYTFVNIYEDCKQETGEPDVQNISLPIKHALYKFSIKEGSETEIVSRVQSHTYSAHKLYNAYGSYISSLVELAAGDEVSVKVSNITFLLHTRENYFGINLI